MNTSYKPHSHSLTHRLILLGITMLILSVITCECGDKQAEIYQPPWIENQYSLLTDSMLQEKAVLNDTLALLTLAWRLMQNKDTQNRAAEMLWDFNQNYDLASEDLNYLTASALMQVHADSVAIIYLGTLTDSKKFPDARHLMANAYKERKMYDEAILIYNKMDKKHYVGIEDSILRCKADLGDTASTIKFARKCLEQKKIGTAATYYNRVVSLSRGVSPTRWSYEAGQAYYHGNNPTRASVYLENADADTNLAELSVLLARCYYKLHVYDSAASKLRQSIAMGDSSNDVVFMLMHSLAGDNRPEESLEASYLGIRLYPEDERFYFIPVRHLYEIQDYSGIKKLVEQARNHITSSFKIDAYYIAALILLDEAGDLDSLLAAYIEKYKFEAGALKEAAKLFRTSVNRDDIATRLETADPTTTYPEMYQFLFWYKKNREDGMLDSCRTMLQNWIQLDTIKERRAVIEALYERDYPDD
jgi:tetratricopeptide (TPR) repeat protein